MLQRYVFLLMLKVKCFDLTHSFSACCMKFIHAASSAERTQTLKEMELFEGENNPVEMCNSFQM